MNKRKIVARILSLVMIICIIFSCFPTNIKAVENDNSDTYTSDDGNLTITMRDGEITIKAISHKASTDIRWRTIGVNISKDKITSRPKVKDKKGWGPVYEAGGYKPLLFKNGESKDKELGDEVTTTIKFTQKQVENALGESFEELEVGTKIYLHGIFQTYNYDTGDIREDYIINWEEIMNEEEWGSETLDDFAKFYNMPIEFHPALQPNTLMYHADSPTGLTLKDFIHLPDAFPSYATVWNELDNKVIVYTNKKTNVKSTYDLIGYEVYAKNNPDKIVDSKYLKDGYDIDEICMGSTTVKIGGMRVFLIYKKRANPKGTPTPIPSKIPVPTKKPTPSTAPKPTPTPIPMPEHDSASDDLTPIETVGCIRADNRGSEKFTVTAGVPTTEGLYTEVKSTQWLMGYDLEKKVGIETYAVRATKDYELSWTVYKITTTTGADGKPVQKKVSETKTETVPVTQSVTIQRAYGYWEINNFDLYDINRAKIDNYALPGGTTTMIPNYTAGYSPPSTSTLHSTSKTSHITVPSQITGGVQLASKSISGGTSKPSIPSEDFTAEADSIIPELTVKNDSLILNGTAVMNDTPTPKEGPTVLKSYLTGLKSEGAVKCNENILYKPNQVIQDIKKNGTYNSSGTITYSRKYSVNSKFNSEITGDIKNLNNVVIHTPILCDPIVHADNDKYVQLINPTSATQLVLDPDQTLNDFTVFISNTGHHSYKSGYYTRDFSHNLRGPSNVSYIASDNGMLLNEVKFPFDVYMKQASGDTFIKKNTWVVLERNTVTFYLPMWVVEGTYTVDCRSIAVNADMSLLDKISEQYVNSELYNYVATNTFKVEVSGRLYGLSIYDLTDYPLWQEVFRVKNSLDLKIHNKARYPDGTDTPTYSKNYSYNYTVGTKNQYGNDTVRNIKYTFPLVNGNHPFYKNIGVLKPGYVVRYSLDTIGCMYSEGCSIKIKPSFYYVDKNGNNRTAVDLYYEETICGKNQKLVKMGNSLDQVNMKTMEVGSPYTGIPLTEIKDTVSILNMKYATFITKIDSIFNFMDIRIPTSFRTFVNKKYTEDTINSDQYPKISETGITKNMLMKQMQRWYGCYYLPSILHAAPLGYDVYGYAEKYGVRFSEDFWKKDGYIIVNFDIVTVDSTGKEHLSYLNASNYLSHGNNSMWIMEGAPLSKTDNKGVTFNFKAGDFIIYYTDRSVQKDYTSGGIY